MNPCICQFVNVHDINCNNQIYSIQSVVVQLQRPYLYAMYILKG